MPVRIWTHDCLVHGRGHKDTKALCLDCGERAEFSHWRASFFELRRRVMELGGGKAPARLALKPCGTCHGQGYGGPVEQWHECEECGGLGGTCDKAAVAEGGLHPRSSKPGANASEARRGLYERNPNVTVVPMVGVVPLAVFDWPKDPRDNNRQFGRSL